MTIVGSKSSSSSSTICVLPGIDDATVAGRLRIASTSKTGRKKAQREYAFRIVLNDGTTTTETVVIGTTQWLTFGEIRNNMKPFESCGTQVPSFPAGSYFGTKDHVHNIANATVRAKDLAEYYTAVLQSSITIGDDSLQNALTLTEESKSKYAKVFHDLALSEDEYHHSLRDEQHQTDRDHAQTFNNMACEKDPIPDLKFETEQSFTLQDLAHNAFGEGTVLPIVDRHGEGWFQWMKMDDRMISTTDYELMKKHHSAITNMENEPLLLLKEKFKWRNYYCELSRYADGKIVPVCSVKCSWSLNQPTDGYGNLYRVKLLGPWSDTTKHKVIQCPGRWPTSFTFGNKSLKTPFATCHKKKFSLMHTFRASLAGVDMEVIKDYKLLVSPGEDCILFIGICCAIDRIHNEIANETERRNIENYT